MPGAVPYGDVIVPYVMAATVAAALESRRRTGGGTYIDASMYEICVQQMFDAIQAAQTGSPAGPRGQLSDRRFLASRPPRCRRGSLGCRTLAG